MEDPPTITRALAPGWSPSFWTAVAENWGMPIPCPLPTAPWSAWFSALLLGDLAGWETDVLPPAEALARLLRSAGLTRSSAARALAGEVGSWLLEVFVTALAVEHGLVRRQNAAWYGCNARALAEPYLGGELGASVAVATDFVMAALAVSFLAGDLLVFMALLGWSYFHSTGRRLHD